MLYIYIVLSLFFVYIMSVSPRKEFLEIVHIDDKVYFLLSGDEYIVTKVNSCVNETIKSTLSKYKNELNSILNEIILVNVYNENLEKELKTIINKPLKKAQLASI